MAVTAHFPELPQVLFVDLLPLLVSHAGMSGDLLTMPNHKLCTFAKLYNKTYHKLEQAFDTQTRNLLLLKVDYQKSQIKQEITHFFKYGIVDCLVLQELVENTQIIDKYKELSRSFNCSFRALMSSTVASLQTDYLAIELIKVGFLLPWYGDKKSTTQSYEGGKNWHLIG